MRSGDTGWALLGITPWHPQPCLGQTQHLLQDTGAACTQPVTHSLGTVWGHLSFKYVWVHMGLLPTAGALVGFQQWQGCMLSSSTHISTEGFGCGGPLPTHQVSCISVSVCVCMCVIVAFGDELQKGCYKAVGVNILCVKNSGVSFVLLLLVLNI